MFKRRKDYIVTIIANNYKQDVQVKAEDKKTAENMVDNVLLGTDLFDFKNKSYETETLKISKESLPLKIKKEDIENVKSILDVLGFEQTSNIVRTRFVFVKDEVKFEIDDYIKPKMLVVSVEGKRDKVDNVYNEVKNMFDIVN